MDNLLKRAKIYSLPEEVLKRVIKRDKKCVYCGGKMIKGHPKKGPTIEHLNNIIHDLCAKDCGTETTLAICCNSCNASRGNKDYSVWFEKEYCIKNKINRNTVAGIVKRYIKKYPDTRKIIMIKGERKLV